MLFSVNSEDYGYDEFGPYDSTKEVLDGARRVAAKADSLADGVERTFMVNDDELVFTSGKPGFQLNGMPCDSLESAFGILSLNYGT